MSSNNPIQLVTLRLFHDKMYIINSLFRCFTKERIIIENRNKYIVYSNNYFYYIKTKALE